MLNIRIFLRLITTFFFSSSYALANTQVTLINGDTLLGEVLSQSEKIVVFQHEVLGTLQISSEQIASLSDKTDIDIGSPAIEQKISKPEDAKADASHSWLLPDWDKRFDIGISGADGNSQSQNIHTALSAITETSDRRWNIQAAYDSSEEDGNKSRDEFFIQANRDWLIPDSPYFYFASGRFDWDEFQDWDYRLNLAGGIGKDFIHRQDWTLRGKTGLGFNREFGGEDDSISPEGLLELASVWQLSEDHKIELTTTFYPQLEELKEFRNITSLAWVNKLNDSMRLKIGLSNEHDTNVPDEVKKNDFKYATSLSWDL